MQFGVTVFSSAVCLFTHRSSWMEPSISQEFDASNRRGLTSDRLHLGAEAVSYPTFSRN